MYNDPNAQPPYGQQPNAQPPYGQSPYSSPYEQQYTPQPTQPPQYPPTQYGAPQMPPVYMAPPPQKNSNKTVWIVLGVIGAVLLLVGGGCCAALYFVGRSAQSFGSTLMATVTADQQTTIANESSPTDQAQSYYLAISVQDYANAYNYLTPKMTTSDGKTLTQALFTQQAQAQDTAEGTVTNYTSTADPNDASKVTVQVTRSNGKTYAVHLTFTQGTYQWVINSFDTI